MPYRSLKTIIPADGWYARFDKEDGSVDIQPLVCWALEDTGWGKVVGLVAAAYRPSGLVAATEAETFIGYLHASQGAKAGVQSARAVQMVEEVTRLIQKADEPLPN